MNKRPKFTPPKPQEEAVITAASLSDPDKPLTDQQLAEWRPMRGRPRLARPKVALTMHVDAEVMDALKSGGPGWQTRVNSLLRDALALKRGVFDRSSTILKTFGVSVRDLRHLWRVVVKPMPTDSWSSHIFRPASIRLQPRIMRCFAAFIYLPTGQDMQKIDF